MRSSSYPSLGNDLPHGGIDISNVTSGLEHSRFVIGIRKKVNLAGVGFHFSSFLETKQKEYEQTGFIEMPLTLS
jgi:hypothetical protein